MVSRLILP